MTVLVVLTVLEIVVLIAALAFYLFWVGTLLARIAGNLEECAEIVRGIVADAALIGPGVEHINETGGVVAGALPLLYGMAEDIVADVTPQPERPAVPEPARPASGTRRSRLLDAVGFAPRLSRTAGGAFPADLSSISAAITTEIENKSRRRLGAGALVGAAAGDWGGGRGRVLADPLVLPGLVVLLIVAARAVDRDELAGYLLAVRPCPAGHLIGADVYLPLGAGALDPAR
jgi:hypothetical protein